MYAIASPACKCGPMSAVLLIFLKYPEPGKVKTRLAATLGAGPAAAVYCRLVAEVCAQLPETVPLVVMFDPVEREAEIVAWLRSVVGDRPLLFWSQGEGDLGARLSRAFALAFDAGFTRVAVIGSDCVELGPAHFEETWRALEAGTVVIGPSEDGGYYLLALGAPCGELFVGIEWSSERVLAQTLGKAAQAGLKAHLLDALPDVDQADDWVRAQIFLAKRAHSPLC